MKLHIIESTLTSKSGHEFEYAKSVYDEWVARGHEARVYSNIGTEREIVDTLRAIPLFPRANYNSPMVRSKNPILQFVVNNFYYFRALRQVDKHSLASDDILLFPTLTHFQLLGIFAWYLLLPVARRPLMVLILRFTNIEFVPQRRLTKHSYFYRFVFRLFSGLLDDKRVVLTTDSDVLAQEYQELSGKPVTVLPIPHMPRLCTIGNSGDASAGAGSIPTIVYIGVVREEKGFHLLPAAIGAVLGKSRVKFVIQSPLKADCPEAMKKVREQLDGFGPDVLVVDRVLDTDEYYAMIAGADAVLIPYEPGPYYGRTSGIFCEALALGRPVIVTDGTWMAQQLRKSAAGVVFADYTPAGLASAIEEYLEDRPAIEARARHAQEGWNEFHSPRTYVDMLLAMRSQKP
ncbi:MAG: glycosyltransferase family 4 protein [Geobacter sp.]|nr:glycosyltransferase family 4 protein [Geobacter sp.]